MIADRAPVPACDEHHCITCGDDGDPMTVVKVDADRGLALCADEDEGRHTVEIALVEPVGPGDRILVHAGTAIAALQPDSGTTSEMNALVAAQDSPTRAGTSARAANESAEAAQDLGAPADTKASPPP